MSAVMLRELAEHRESIRLLEASTAAIGTVAEVLCASFAAGGTLYTLGNGGSAADAQHLTGELVGRFRRTRRPLPAVSLATDPTVITCIANDFSFDDVFSRQIEALTKPCDVVAAFTTSGRSSNVVKALQTARARAVTTVLFGGADGGAAVEYADHVLLSPATSTTRIQELHTVMLHLISTHVDEWAYQTERA